MRVFDPAVVCDNPAEEPIRVLFCPVVTAPPANAPIAVLWLVVAVVKF